MTIEEAIKDIKENIQPSVGGKSLEMAIESLEKQIPKKPTDVRYFGEAGYYIGLCPCCNSGNNSEYHYCGDCGQAIDWRKNDI